MAVDYVAGAHALASEHSKAGPSTKRVPSGATLAVVGPLVLDEDLHLRAAICIVAFGTVNLDPPPFGHVLTTHARRSQ